MRRCHWRVFSLAVMVALGLAVLCRLGPPTSRFAGAAQFKEPELETVVATYRDIPVRSFLPDEVVAFIIHPTMSAEDRQSMMALKWQASYMGFQQTMRETIYDYWAKEFGLKTDPAQVEAEKRDACAKQVAHLFDGKGISAEKVRKEIENVDMGDVGGDYGQALDVCLLWLYQKDPKAAESMYGQYFKQRIPPQDWARLKRDCGTQEAFRAYACERIASCVEEEFRGAAEGKIRDKQLVDTLIARKIIEKPKDLDSWLQSELQHVKMLRCDVLALFVEEEERPAINIPKPLAPR